MKWWFRKKEKGKPPPRVSGSGRRITGVVTEMPRGLRMFLEFCVAAVLIVGIAWGSKQLFYLYFRTNPQFRLKNVYDNVKVTTGKMVTPDLVYQAFGLTEGTNLFAVNIEEQRNKFLLTPNIKDVSVTRQLPDKLAITIIEREPLVRVKPIGWVADEDGVVFIRYAGTGNLPLVKLSDEFAQVKPGDKLGGMELAAIRLVGNAMRPGCKVHLMELDASRQDYLWLTFADYRRAKFAWPRMLEPGKEADALMQKQLDKLAASMDSPIGSGRQVWDATQPNRIFAMPMINE